MWPILGFKRSKYETGTETAEIPTKLSHPCIRISPISVGKGVTAHRDVCLTKLSHWPRLYYKRYGSKLLCVQTFDASAFLFTSCNLSLSPVVFCQKLTFYIASCRFLSNHVIYHYLLPYPAKNWNLLLSPVINCHSLSISWLTYGRPGPCGIW